MKEVNINKLIKEATFNTSRSGGKGGQNVNKVETKVELVFNIPDSLLLDDEIKNRLSKKLSTKIDKNGNLRITSQTERSQLGNKKKTIIKFANMIEAALIKENIRIKSLPSKNAKQRRLDEKKIHAKKKKLRAYNIDP